MSGKSARKPEDPFASLQRYGFDPQLFAGWQKAVGEGRLAKANNAVTSELLAPPPGTIKQIPGNRTKAYGEIEKRGKAALAASELGVVILNGGMATRFGGVVKGVVDVLGPGRSFLALAIEDVLAAQRTFGAKIHVFVMNSFATEQKTREHFEQHGHFGLDPAQIHHFNQFVSVRMEKDGSVFRTGSGEMSPYGPGHGDFPAAFRKSGELQRFLAAGGRWLLVRNVDNLGARIDPLILGHHVASSCEVTVELVPKWPEDVGGSPYLYENRLQLVEGLRYPAGFNPDIVDVFNCNTFTFTAPALDRDLELGWYFVEKTVDGKKAVQIEHLLGEVTRFLTTNFLRVKRSGKGSRFLPVKTPEDLEAARDEIAEMYDSQTGH